MKMIQDWLSLLYPELFYTRFATFNDWVRISSNAKLRVFRGITYRCLLSTYIKHMTLCLHLFQCLTLIWLYQLVDVGNDYLNEKLAVALHLFLRFLCPCLHWIVSNRRHWWRWMCAPFLIFVVVLIQICIALFSPGFYGLVYKTLQCLYLKFLNAKVPWMFLACNNNGSFVIIFYFNTFLALYLFPSTRFRRLPRSRPQMLFSRLRLHLFHS